MDKMLKDIRTNLKKFKKKIAEFFDLKDAENRKKVLSLGAVFAIIILITTIYFVTSKNISTIERNALMNQSDDIKNFIEYIDVDKVQTDNYILFALQYSQQKNTKSILSSSEISDLIREKFNKYISPEDIKNTGVTEILLNNSVVYNPGEDTYEISITRKPAAEIAKTAVNYYKVNKVSKINKKKYNIVYQEYIIENPYEVLNHYINYNAQNSDTIDISPFRNYLAGSDSLNTFKNHIKSEDIDKYSKKDHKLKVTYVIDNDKLLIDKVSRCKLC